MKITCVLSVSNLVMLYFLIWIPRVGPGAFGLSTTITFVINAGILIAILRRRLGPFGVTEIVQSVARSLIACAAMAAVIYVIRWKMTGMSNLLILLVCIPVGAAVFIAAAWLMRAPELKEIMARPASETPGDSATPVTTQ
jgi:peptidoglycan biosynthesis protein MviN/MurJ (putative lipid II flippase)